MDTADEEMLLSTLANRSDAYRMYARLFLSPLEQSDIEGLASLSLDAAAADLQDEELLARGFNDMGRGLHRRHTGTQKILSTDFTMCFDGLAAFGGVVARPYASLFAGCKTGENAELCQEPFEAVREIYRREGVEPDPGLKLPGDHLSFELSFMADLSDKAAAALRESDYAEALRLIEVSKDFLGNHIANWYPDFREAAAKIVETRFYRGVLEATEGYMVMDEGTLSDLGASLGEEMREAA